MLKSDKEQCWADWPALSQFSVPTPSLFTHSPSSLSSYFVSLACTGTSRHESQQGDKKN